MMSPPSTSGVASMCFTVPQSYSLTMTSCETSTSRRVRYPESAVFRAVSARPLRAPWVDVKYSRTVSPSRKFEVIGVSMISPDGFAMSPRMPASWRICCLLPRAQAANPPARRHARAHGEAVGRDHRDPDHLELPRGTHRPRIFHVDPRRAQGPGGHGPEDCRLRVS